MRNPHFDKLSRRRLFNFGMAGLALAGGAGAYRALSGVLRAGNQVAKFEENCNYEGLREKLGKYIYLTPQKLGGGTHAVDLNTQKTLAWISYWNYGGDPYKGFEFINSTQGGDNTLMYGLNTRIKENGMLGQFGQGNHIYRVGYDGKTGQMELLEDVAESTGLGLGVHTIPFVDGTGFAVGDGQKDVAAFFSRARGREKTVALAAFRADWVTLS